MINPEKAIDPLLPFNGEHLIWSIFESNDPGCRAGPDCVNRCASLLHLVETRPFLGLQLSRLITSGPKNRNIFRPEDKGPGRESRVEVSGHGLHDGGFREMGRQPLPRDGVVGSSAEPAARLRHTDHGAKEQKNAERAHWPNSRLTFPRNKIAIIQRKRNALAVCGTRRNQKLVTRKRSINGSDKPSAVNCPWIGN